MAVATETFKELTLPLICILILKSACSLTSLEIPKPSDPTTNTTGDLNTYTHVSKLGLKGAPSWLSR